MRRALWLRLLAASLPVIAVLVAARFFLPPGIPWLGQQLLLGAFGIGAVALAEAVVWRSDPEPVLGRLGFRRAHRPAVRAALLVSAPMWLFLPVMALARGEAPSLRPDWPVLLLGVAIVNGLTAEVLHRAFVFGRARAAWPFWRAAAFGSAMFAAQHLYLVFVIGVMPGLASVMLALLLAFPLARLFEGGGNSAVGRAIAHTGADAPYLISGDPQDGMMLIARMGVVMVAVRSVFALRPARV